MKLKKLLATGLALCMAGSMLAGCGSGSGTTTAAATTAAPAGTTAEATTAADGTTAAGTTAAASAGETDFPTKNVSGIIQWGAGGGTDNLDVYKRQFPSCAFPQASPLTRQAPP